MKIRKMKRARDRQVRRAWIAEWLIHRLVARGHDAPILTSIVELIRTSRDAGAMARVTISRREEKAEAE
jgi:hypothetical protein